MYDINQHTKQRDQHFLKSITLLIDIMLMNIHDTNI